jgi:hypothetical protein
MKLKKMELVPILTEMTCYEYFKMKVEDTLKLEDFDKYETVSKDGWLRTYHNDKR